MSRFVTVVCPKGHIKSTCSPRFVCHGHLHATKACTVTELPPSTPRGVLPPDPSPRMKRTHPKRASPRPAAAPAFTVEV